MDYGTSPKVVTEFTEELYLDVVSLEDEVIIELIATHIEQEEN